VPQECRHIVFKKAYPSPPLTGSALQSIIPLPDIHGVIFTDYPMCKCPTDSAQDHSVAREVHDLCVPLSTPPTHFLCNLDLPETDPITSVVPSDHFPGPRLCSHGPDEEGSDFATARNCSRRVAGNASTACSRSRQSADSHASTSSSRGWSFEGNLSDLESVPEEAATQYHHSPIRGDSGFEESLPHQRSNVERMPSLSESSEASYSKIEPSSYWTPQSPVSMHGSSILDDHPPFNPAIAKADYRHDSLFVVSPQDSQSDSTPSWSSMDWSTGDERDSDFSPVSPRPRSLSLDLPDLDHLPSDDHFGFDPAGSQSSELFVPGYSQAPPHSPWFGQDVLSPEDTSYRDIHQMDMMNVDGEPPPSPRPAGMLLLPPCGPDSDNSFTDTMIPSEENTWSPPLVSPSPLRRSFLDIQGTFIDQLCLTPIPRSPHAFSSSLPDLSVDESIEPPSAPSSPHLALPPLGDDFSQPPSSEFIDGTVAPALLAPPPNDHEGLGLFLQPISIDPPLARSPSPDDDDLQFLDVQLDPTSSNLELGEFLQLRAVRRRALTAEREARNAETELGERVSSAANALLPPSHADAGASDHFDTEMTEDSDAEKRARKRELHIAMDMRAEARRVRKREKQRSKEVGALLDLKMERGVAPGKGAMRSIAQLVANMVLRRRDNFRSLANRKTTCSEPRPYVRSSLCYSVSAEDLFEIETDSDTDTDMDLDEE